MGETLVDGGVAFRVRSVGPERSIAQRADRGGGRLTPGANRRFIVAEVGVVNGGRAPADPFCGSGGAELRVVAGEAVEPIEQLYGVEGKGICSGGLPSREQATYKLVFQVPAGDNASRLDLWNGDEPGDILGKTRIAFRL